MGRGNLTQGVIWKQLLIYAIPLLLSNFLQQLYNTADLLIVGRFAGASQMAAVGATGSISNMIIGLFLGLATGCSVVVAQKYGAEDYRLLYKAVHSSMAIALLSGIIIAVFGYISTPKLLSLMNVPADVIGYATDYMRLFFIGVPALLVYNIGAGILRSVGDSKGPFIFLIVSAITNIVLDIVFIVYMDLGVIGAAYATLIAQVISAILVMLSLATANSPYRLFLKDIKMQKQVVVPIAKIGVPAGLQTTIIAFSNVIIQANINSFGSDAIAGVAAASRIDGFILTGLQALSLAATTFAGQNIGARKYHRLQKGLRVSLFLTLIVGLGFGLIALVLGRPLLYLFNPDPAVIDYGFRLMRLLAPLYFILGLSDIFGGFIRGAGKSIITMAIAAFTMFGLRILWIFIMFQYIPKIDIIFLSYPISWTFTLILTASYYRFGKWLKKEADVS